MEEGFFEEYLTYENLIDIAKIIRDFLAEGFYLQQWNVFPSNKGRIWRSAIINQSKFRKMLVAGLGVVPFLPVADGFPVRLEIRYMAEDFREENYTLFMSSKIHEKPRDPGAKQELMGDDRRGCWKVTINPEEGVMLFDSGENTCYLILRSASQ